MSITITSRDTVPIAPVRGMRLPVAIGLVATTMVAETAETAMAMALLTALLWPGPAIGADNRLTNQMAGLGVLLPARASEASGAGTVGDLVPYHSLFLTASSTVATIKGPTMPLENT